MAPNAARLREEVKMGATLYALLDAIIRVLTIFNLFIQLFQAIGGL